MFLRAGLVSLILLLASRVLGLARESAQAAAFGASGAGDVATLVLSLPDWIAGVLASGGLAYVLLPAWARLRPGQVAAAQRRLVRILFVLGVVLALALAWGRTDAVRALAAGLPANLQAPAAQALLWSAVALPLAFVAAAWSTRLQHEADFVGLYAANLVVNLSLIGALVAIALGAHPPLHVLGAGLLLAMGGRLAWLGWRQPAASATADAGEKLPGLGVWAWAAAAAGLPLALPFVARSLASQQGEGALVVFNFAWKLVELPLLLAVQLVGVLALGPISRALAERGHPAAGVPIRRGLALAFTLACACAAGLVVAAPAVAHLLFGWGRMEADALVLVAEWGRIAAWSLLPQALLTIGVAVLAARGALRPAAFAYGAALALLLMVRPDDGATLMRWLNGLLLAAAVVVLVAAREDLRGRVPWATFAVAIGSLLAVRELAHRLLDPADPGLAQLGMGGLAGIAVLAVTWSASVDLRAALRR